MLRWATVQQAAETVLDLLELADKEARRDGARLPAEWAAVRSSLKCVSVRHGATTVDGTDSVPQRGHMPALLLDLDETAEALRVSRRSVERYIAAGRLPAVRVAGKQRVRPDDLKTFVAVLAKEQAA